MLKHVLKLNRNQRSRASFLRRLAGLPAGLRQSRRGSFLILVVGTLALIAVISVVYFAIGRSDRQTSAAAVQADKRDDVPVIMRDYIAGIIADDLFDVVYLGERAPDPNNPANNVPVFRREAWDYPSTAFEAVVPTAFDDIIRPVTVGGGGAGADARFHFNPTGNYTGTDPWLAMPEPTLLNFDAAALDNESEPANYWRERLDWGQISNIAPDGMFVNLFNLRGNFDATHAEMRGRTTGAQLTLYETADLSQRGATTDYGGQVVDTFSRDAIPAQLSTRQRAAVHPGFDPNYGPDQGLHLLYQWADADGDGILDSRWFEFVEDRDPNDNFLVNLLNPDPNYRYFFAARITDLSARVNVNTATDATLPPERLDPFGLTPAAVDLRGLLTYEHFYSDVRNDFDGSGGQYGFGPDRHVQPNYPGAPDELDPQNYAQYTTDNAYFAGEKAYDALRTYLDLGITPGGRYQGLVNADTTGNVNREFSLDQANVNPYWNAYGKLGGDPLVPTSHYEFFAGYGLSGGTGDLTGGNSPSGVFRPFGIDALEDLLTFGSANDDRRLSTLEVALDGRANPDDVTGAPDAFTLAERFGPLRSSRSTDLERTRLFQNRLNIQFIDEAKAALYTDLRQRLTTISGARPIRPTAILAERDGRNFVVPADRFALDNDEDLKRTRDNLFDTASGLYRFYADALAPWSGLFIDGASVWDVGNAPEHATLFYGHRGPHLAVRTAAHLAINMRDAYDVGDASTVRTLVLNGSDSFRNNELNDVSRSPLYPWQLLDLDETNASLASRLPDLTSNPIAGVPDAVNVFGIEAQPFLVEAASFSMYTDTPEALGGDDDTGETRLNGQVVYRRTPSIDGRVPDGGNDNPDFIFSALVFQLHNPFDESITLSGNPTDDGDITTARRDLYYIQYGDLYFKLVNIEGGVEQDVTLGGGETRTFYVLSQHLQNIAERIHTITGDADYGARALEDEVTRFDNWLDRQFGDEAVQIARFEPTTGQAEIPAETDSTTDTVDLQEGSESDRRVVRLWRVEKPEEDALNGGLEVQGLDESGTNPNVIENDTLIDRLREPDGAPHTPVLDRELPSSAGPLGAIENADKGPEPPDPNASPDNRGQSITRYGVIRRNADPSAGNLDGVPLGALGAYLVEVKDQSVDGHNEADDDGSGSDLEISDFSGVVGADTLDELLSDQTGSNLADRLVPTLTLDAQKKADDPRIGLNVQEMPDNRGGFSYEDLYPDAHLDNSQFNDANGISTARVADILLPLGIGPFQVPDPAYHGGDEDVEWTTLSEALAMALNYDLPETADAQSVYAGAFNAPINSGDPEILLDRGQLQIDAFVPFFDADDNGRFDPTLDADDRRWGLGVPIAATLLDNFQALERRFGSLTTPTFGQLNINTVSRETARAIPGLSPGSETGPDGVARWWWDNDVHGQRSDIATTLVAYRDRLSMYPRAVNPANYAGSLINFRDWWDADLQNRFPAQSGFAPGTIEAALAGERSRAGAAGVAALHETPGFRSVGELLLLRDFGYVNNEPGYQFPHDIDRLSADGDAIDEPGVESVGYEDEFGNLQPDEIEDDYDERLVLANAALASASVRSDYFVAWFIVHGYRESDVNGLGRNDPLVPSIARRFMMVVDRSNVVSPGDRPRILLFKEVPL